MIDRIQKKLRRTYRQLTKKPYEQDPAYPAYWFNEVLRGKAAEVVQIGSNDGKTNDPLYKLLHQNSRWTGLLVEPIPYVYAKLVSNYPDTRFRTANVAVNAGKELPFYYVDTAAKEAHPDLPFWYDQLGSFNRGHLEKHLDGKLTPFIQPLRVEGLSLQGLFDRYGVETIDVLHIDAEGYDWEVLQQLDRQRYRPAFVLFEHHHLAVADKAAALAFLHPDYTVLEAGIDYLAVHRFVAELRRMKKYLKTVSGQ